MQGFTLGRLVDYSLSKDDLPENLHWRVGQVIPALIVSAYPDFDGDYSRHREGYANLIGFPDEDFGLSLTIWLKSRKYSERSAPGTWRWQTQVVVRDGRMVQVSPMDKFMIDRIREICREVIRDELKNHKSS